MQKGVVKKGPPVSFKVLDLESGWRLLIRTLLTSTASAQNTPSPSA